MELQHINCGKPDCEWGQDGSCPVINSNQIEGAK